LEVDVDFAEGADDDVGADAAVIGDIAVGVVEADVGGVVCFGDADAGFGGGDDVGGGFVGRGGEGIGFVVGAGGGGGGEAEEEGGGDGFHG
jgi:hypothetical protein